MEGESSNTKRARPNDHHDHRFLDIVLSWSLADIYNENLYKNQVLNSLSCFEFFIILHEIKKHHQ
jgi:hypothetical protein